MTSLFIEWKHFDKEGKTCVRCSGTGVNLANAIKEMQTKLARKGMKIKFKETKLSESQMPESNEILIDGIPLERLILDAKVGNNSCSSCTDLVGKSIDCNCRTISKEKEVYEEIPVALIKQAILNKLNLK